MPDLGNRDEYQSGQSHEPRGLPVAVVEFRQGGDAEGARRQEKHDVEGRDRQDGASLETRQCGDKPVERPPEHSLQRRSTEGRHERLEKHHAQVRAGEEEGGHAGDRTTPARRADRQHEQHDRERADQGTARVGRHVEDARRATGG